MMQLGVVFNDLGRAPGTLMSGPLPLVCSMGRGGQLGYCFSSKKQHVSSISLSGSNRGSL